MTTDSLPASTGAVNDQAINRVLDAERAAARAVERCEHRARELLREARLQAQRIQERCDTRITLIHMRCSRRLSEHSRQVAQAEHAAAPAEQTGSIGGEAISLAIAKLAASLSGADGERE